jgi:hypothetical protein
MMLDEAWKVAMPKRLDPQDPKLCHENELRRATMSGNKENHSNRDSYAQEKLYVAMLCLIADRPLRKRLADAAVSSLIRLMPAHFSNDEHLKAWQQIMDDLTWAPPDSSDDGSIEATIRRMLDEDARKVAEAILSLYHKLSGGWRD